MLPKFFLKSQKIGKILLKISKKKKLEILSMRKLLIGIIFAYNLGGLVRNGEKFKDITSIYYVLPIA